MPKTFNEAGKNRNNNNGENDNRKITFDERNISEKVPPPDKRINPKYPPKDAKANETPEGHLTDTGHERGKGANNGNEAGNNNRLATVFFVKMLGSVQIFLFKKTNIFSMKNLRAHEMTDRIIGQISRYGSHGQKHEQPFKFKRPHRGKSTQPKKK